MQGLRRNAWAAALAVLLGCSSGAQTGSGSEAQVNAPSATATIPNAPGSAGSAAANPLLPNGTAGSGQTPVVMNTAGSMAAPPAVPMAGGVAMMPPPMNLPTAGSAPPAMPMAGSGPMLGPGQSLPPISDYAGNGPFAPTIEVAGSGPDGNYTMFRPANLSADGFKFSPLTWGNGITTTPQIYPILLNTVASHGFIIIASNSTAVTPDLMTAGLDWLIAQNDAGGELDGTMDVTRAVTMGYSLGGGGAVTAGSHPNVVTTIAMHPAPGFPGGLHGPVLFFSGTNDTVCIPATFVQPQFDGAPTQAFYGLLDGADHLEPVLTGGRDLAPSIAWLRWHVYGDQDARVFFDGPSCTLCVPPWTGQTRNWP